MRALLLAAGLLVQGLGYPPFDVTSLILAPPLQVTEIAAKTLKGDPRRLCWSADGTALYLQTVSGPQAAARVNHFTVSLYDRELRPIADEPGWAAEYWSHKVSESAPGFPSLRIEAQLDRQRMRAAPLTGSVTRSGATADAVNSVTFTSLTLSFLGVEIGRWINEPPTSGTTFGWGPTGSGAMAYVDGDGRLTLIDKERRRQIVAAASNASLPAWSPDGGYLAYLQRAGRNKLKIMSIAIVKGDGAQLPRN